MRTGVALATSSVIGRALAVVAAAGLVLAPRPGRADDDDQDEKAANQGRVVIDRVEVEPSRLGLTRVRALVSAMELRGARIPFVGAGKNGIQVKVGSADTSDPLTGVFETSDVELALVVVLPVTGDFDVNGDLDPIREHLKNELLTPLGKLGPRAQFAVIGYAESTAGSRRLGNLGAATGALDKLEVDTSQANLIAAVQRGETMAKNAIKKPKVPGTLVRGIVVLVSDGSGVTVDDHEAITKLGLQAAKDHVRIDSLAYSPQARKRPLFALGELSRQSQGVFRWIRTMDGWTAALGQLVDEVQRETVVTFYAPPDQLADKKLSVTVPLAGNPIEAEGVKLPDAACGPDPCDGYCNHGVCIIPLRETSGGFLHWLLIGGAGIVGLGVIGIGGASLARRRKGAAPPFPPGLVPGAPGMPGMPGAPAMPGMPGAPAMPAMP
ncbi:MAG TPA: hypothetical protein VHE35_10495, partial [Kofleriaceae bacterium]|nr:hypothetical protein [Kofleriaceae bacterium]